MFNWNLSYKYLGIALIVALVTYCGAVWADVTFTFSGSGTIGSISPSRLDLTAIGPTIPATPIQLGSTTTVYCADSVNGSDANTGIAAGTYPAFTNCKQTASAAAALVKATTVPVTLYMTGVFRDSTVANNLADMMDINPAASLGGAAGNPIIITTYGPALFSDPISGATGGAIVDGSDCLASHAGDCAGAANSPPVWTLVAGNTYKTPYAAWTYAVYLDSIATWPDGLNPITGQGNAGLTAASCIAGPCVDSVTAASLLPTWISSHTYGANSDVQAIGINGLTPGWWHTATGGTGSTNSPNCTSGCTAGTTTFTDGTITWVFEGSAAGKIGSVETSLGNGAWYWDGQSLYVTTPTGDSPANHVIEAVNHIWGLKLDANAPNLNHLNVTHLGIRHVDEDAVLFRNDSTTVCPTDNAFLYNEFIQTGPSNVDLNQFGNGFRYVDDFTEASGANSCATSTATFAHNYMAFNGDHGGNFTLQVGNLPMMIAYNNIAHGNHGNLNLVGNGSVFTTGVNMIGNYLHDDIRSANESISLNSVAGIFVPRGTSINIIGNFIYNQLDTGFCAGLGQCSCINLQLGTSAVVENNTCDTAMEGLYAPSGAGIVYKGNINSNMTTAQIAPNTIVTATSVLSSSDFNVFSSITNPVNFNGTQTSFATWNTDGFDTHSSTGNPSYAAYPYPFTLNAGSVGLGLVMNQGFWGNFGAANAGANASQNGWTP